MRNLKYILPSLAMLAFPVLCSGQSIDEVLASVEANNLELQANRSLVEARSIESRVDNQLENPEVEYVRSWGVPAEAGTSGELVAAQSFDFPTAYVQRARRAALLRSRYDTEHAQLRQQTLLEAKLLCIEIISLREQLEVARMRESDAGQVAEICGKLFETGQGSVLEKNRAEMEYAAARNARSLLEIDIEAALNRLCTLNGGQKIDVGSVELALDRPLPLEQIEAVYVETDPSLLISASEIELSRQNVKVERAQMLPKIKLGYKLTHSPGQHFNGVVMGLSIPIFSGHRNVRTAKAQTLYAETAYRSMCNDLHTTLAALYDKAAVIERTIGEYETANAESERYREYLNRAIEAGQISATDYFSSLVNYYDVQSARIQFRRDLASIYARINAVLL